MLDFLQSIIFLVIDIPNLFIYLYQKIYAFKTNLQNLKAGDFSFGFDLDKRPEYHKVYRLRDETGHEFSDMLEAHTKNRGIIEVRVNRLYLCLMDDDWYENLKRAASDKAYRKWLYKEYAI